MGQYLIGFYIYYFYTYCQTSKLLVFTACGGVLDVAFIVDSSGSVGDNFKTIKTFVKKFIDGFDIGLDKTHVALVTFSDQAKTEFGLVDSTDASIVKQFVDRVKHVGGETYIDSSLKEVNKEVFSYDKGWRRNTTSVSTHENCHSKQKLSRNTYT